MNTNQKTLGQIAINGYSACLSDEHEDRWEFAAQAVRQHVLATETDDGWRLLDVLRQHVDSMRCERNKLKEELATSKKCLVIANRSADDQMQQKREAQKERDSLRAQLTECQKRVEELEQTQNELILSRDIQSKLAKEFMDKVHDREASLREEGGKAFAAMQECDRLKAQLTEALNRLLACEGYLAVHPRVSEEARQLRDKSPWIPCSERLPDDTKEPDGGTTCVFVHHKIAPVCSSPFQMSNVAYLRKHPEEYTHWMPIPPLPPKPQEDEADSLAKMVIEWVEGGMRLGTDWKSTLANPIRARLQRLASRKENDKAVPQGD